MLLLKNAILKKSPKDNFAYGFKAFEEPKLKRSSTCGRNLFDSLIVDSRKLKLVDWVRVNIKLIPFKHLVYTLQ